MTSGWTVTIAHLVYLPSRALELVQAGDDAKDVVFVDVDFQTGKCFSKGVELEEQVFAFDHYAIIQESIKRIQGPPRLESDLPLSAGGGVHCL